ncbi:phosphoribosylglycinamide formyltransferase [Hwanghaeella sp.]|uniref:phosphoribosylglycinamide formyltransferase n=1 Tax=Hwanghaeella sp. TaxID=2605943 RepID=UPI003CCC3C46
MTEERRRIAVLVSGGGSNLQALIDECAKPDSPARIVLVLSNNADAFGLQRAAKAGIATAVVNHRDFPDRSSFEQAISRELAARDVEIVCLAGFMRVLTPGFVENWHDRMLNIHPSLLPAYKGLHTHERALADGMAEHGCTVHLVRPALDDGPLLIQAKVPVLPEDDADRLAARVLVQEHRIYPAALRLLAADAVTVDGEQALINGRPGPLIWTDAD